MLARHKLNVGFVGGSIVVAAMVATLFPSWLVFGSVTLMLLVICQQSGRIRFGR